MAIILNPSLGNLELCKDRLENSEVVAIPTETVYGLAANALDTNAVNKIFEIKNRPFIDPLIIHVPSIIKADSYCKLTDQAKILAEKFWPGPLTMVLPKKPIIPDLVTAKLDSVAIRCPKNKILLDLLKILNFPLAAPSANPFGYISPTKAEHVEDSLGKKIEYILNGENCSIGIESTIVDLRNDSKPSILRPGPITQEMLEDVTKIKFNYREEEILNSESSGLLGPGLLKNHYSPNTSLELRLKDEILYMAQKKFNENTAYLFLSKPKYPKEISKKSNIFWLSDNGEVGTIIQNLYHKLRLLDKAEYSLIIVEKFDNIKGIKMALLDRLKKASS